ncbi:hypothetical protein IG631_07744 [Alternaria alternata]|nr:hypothetical protein IG631_07744 [Alternaria alternata]
MKKAPRHLSLELGEERGVSEFRAMVIGSLLPKPWNVLKDRMVAPFGGGLWTCISFSAQDIVVIWVKGKYTLVLQNAFYIRHLTACWSCCCISRRPTRSPTRHRRVTFFAQPSTSNGPSVDRLASSRKQRWYMHPCYQHSPPKSLTILISTVRSPCPALNSLANHGFIHRDGRNMTIPHLISGLAAGLNIGADFTTAISGAGLLSSPNPLGGSFDLDDLSQHNFPIEHDASMSRQDAALGNPQPFYNPNWQQYISFFAGKDQTDVPTAATAKYARTQDSQKRNSEFVYGLREAVFSYGENALYLQTMGSDPLSGKAKVEYVRSFFEQEKLPFELGWRPSVLPITLPSLGAMVVELQASSPEPLPEGVKIVADSYKNVFIAVAGGSNILGNLTAGISEALGL